MFSLRLSLILVSLAAPSAALAQAPAPEPKSPMRFEWVREGPADVCRDHCREWVSVVGQVTPDTARDFAAFARTRSLTGAMVVLDSPGGAQTSGLEIGREFRRLGVTTTVGQTVKLPPDARGEQRASLSPRARCASICSFMLLGGVRRNVPDEARVTVHQIWSAARREDAEAASYTARDLVNLQRELGLAAKYVVEMGVNIEFFEISMRIPPWEALRSLNKAELRRFGVHNFDGLLGAVAAGPAAPAAMPAPPPSTPPRAEAGWALADRDGKRVLARTHSLTIEGQEIGNFELALFCGSAPATVQLVYSERRTSASGAPDRVAQVITAIGREREPLTVESSVAGQAPGEMISKASATIPASYVRPLAEPARPAFVVATQTAARVRSQIRMGSVGLADNITALLGGCPR